MSLNVYWSDRLEKLADLLFQSWEKSSEPDSFSRTCIAVGDLCTRNWLKRYFLFQRERGRRRILANIDFKPLPELVNDWLAAMCGKDGERRNPARHPYAKNVLAWRINAILKAPSPDPELTVPLSYVRRAKESVAAKRRFELSVRLAQLFDDYLGTRYRMLDNWAAGKLPAGEVRWQAALYRLLAQENPETYTRDYVRALAPANPPETAFENGFPRYAAIHVFDAAFAPWPFLAMLRKLSDAVPVTFWNFNPSREYWLDDPTEKEARKEWARAVRSALENGGEPPDSEPENLFETPDARLLGALAGGARGVLSAQLDLTDGACEWIGDATGAPFASLRGLVPEVHVCHTPRRELEAARDALCRFFAETPDARPGDALVLCSDWGTYAPLVPSVFGEGGAGDFPFALAGGIMESTPITHSLEELLAFRTNRFEVGAVFSLLGVPTIAGRFGIDPGGLSVLREMVRSNNLHWGFDDADVNEILGTSGTNHPFTWRRGLDRFVADALIGAREDPEDLVDLGDLGRLRPRGAVEDERARLVGALHAFVSSLSNLRAFLKKSHTVEEWRERLLAAIDEFYLDDDTTNRELSDLRRAILSATGDALAARDAGTAPGKDDPVPGDVMCAAVLSSVQSVSLRPSSSGEGVRVAPLTIGSAVPARFVWICGLSDGVFPRAEHRPAFDLIGRRPTLFDATLRERDALSLLKAAMGARERLALSYVGRDVRSNEKLPAAVPLTDLVEWYEASGLEVKTFQHPLQAYSPCYFTAAENPGQALPPSYSAVNRAVAVALESRSGGSLPAPLSVIPFEPGASGVTAIEVEDLVSFYTRPYRFLARNRLNISLNKAKYDLLEDEDSLGANFPPELKRKLLLRGADAVDVEAEAERLIESGVTIALDELSDKVQAEADAGEEYRCRGLKYTKALSAGFACADMTAAEAFVAWEDGAESVPYCVELDVEGHRVVLTGCRNEIELNVLPEGRLAHVFEFSDYPSVYDSTKIGVWIRHVAGHAAGGRFVSAMMCTRDAPVRTYRPLPREEARGLLVRMVSEAMKPMPFDRAAAMKNSDCPAELAAALGDYVGRIVSSRK